MTNNQLEKGIFVIYIKQTKSLLTLTHKELLQIKNSIKKRVKDTQRGTVGVVCVVGGRRRFTNI